MSGGTTVKMGFEDLIPKNAIYAYYAANYDGYLGFNFYDLGLITKAGIEYNGLTDTGFGSVLHGDAEAFTTEPNITAGYYGIIQTSYARESFTLKSGVFATYKGTQSTGFETWDANGHVKATILISLGQTATTINFANYGSDFKNITQVDIFANANNGYTTVMDNLKVHWNGVIPGSGFHRHHAHTSHPVLGAMAAHAPPDHSRSGERGADGQHLKDFHSELASLVSLSHRDGGLTAEFSLPQAEHFGT